MELTSMRALLTVSVLCLGVVGEWDYYEILGLSVEREEASERDIKTAWRKLSKLHHPDVSGEDSRRRYQDIQRAYDVLGDRRKRRVYDIRGEEGVRALEKPQQPSDPLSAMFGFSNPDEVRRGPSVRYSAVVALEDMYNGAAHEFSITKQKLCRKCRGSGAASKEDIATCTKCKGSGIELQRIQLGPGFVQQVQRPCSKCGGKGKRVTKSCDVCHGRRVARGASTLHIDVEQGAPENFDVVYEMEGDQSPDEIPGDVIVTLRSAPHAVFQRRGDDLAMSMTLSLVEALGGFTKEMNHLDGHEIVIEEIGVVQHGSTRVIKGEGMPKHNVPSEHGDLIVTYAIVLPTSLSASQRESIAAALR